MTFNLPSVPAAAGRKVTTAVTKTVNAAVPRPKVVKRPPARPSPPVPQIPGVYPTAQIPGIAHTQAQAAVQAQLGALPTQGVVSAPYDAQNRQIDSTTQGLINQLNAAQTYKVNLATGLPQAELTQGQQLQDAAAQSAAKLGGTAGALPTTAAAGTLASFGTSAANEIAAQAGAAPAAANQYHQHVNDQLSAALNALTTQRSGILAQQPTLEQQALDKLNQGAFQGYVADRNYQLAAGNANFNQAYKTAALKTGVDKTAATIKAQNQRAAASRDNAWKIASARIAASEKNAAANRAAAGDRASATSGKARSSSLASAERYVDSNLQSRYKSKAGTGGTVTGWDIAYSYIDPATDTRKTGTKHLTPQQYQAYKTSGPQTVGLPPGTTPTGATQRTKTGTAGQPPTNPDRAVAWAKGYLSQQNSAYGWGLDQATLTRMAQQSVRNSGLWPNYGKRPPAPVTRTRNPGVN